MNTSPPCKQARMNAVKLFPILWKHILDTADKGKTDNVKQTNLNAVDPISIISFSSLTLPVLDTAFLELITSFTSSLVNLLPSIWVE